jgi:hypothetical protein
MTSASSVDLFFIRPRMGHMHNFASTRELFWERTGTWADWGAARDMVTSVPERSTGAMTMHRNVFHAVASEGTIYLMREFDAPETARVLDEERIGFVMLVPAMIQAILTAVAGAGRRAYAELRTIMYGGSAISEAGHAGARESSPGRWALKCGLEGSSGGPRYGEVGAPRHRRLRLRKVSTV